MSLAWLVPLNTRFFIRPNKDLKEFTGLVVSFNEILEWNPEREDKRDNATLETEIIVSKPVNIKKEYRMIIVDGKISSGSKYIEDGKLNEDRNVPQDVVNYTERVANIWSPADISPTSYCT